MGIRENFLAVQKRIEKARKNAPDPQREILLVGVTKGVSIERVREAIEAGLREVGENRVQEAKEKSPQITGVRWHMVGHLQRNKAKDAIQLFQLIHSVDSLRLAETLEEVAFHSGKEVSILLQVNPVRDKISNGVNPQENPGQYGVSFEEAPRLANDLSAFEHLKLLGLMMIAPLSEDPETVRPSFRRLRELKESLEKEKNPRIEMRYLSMGMSQDFEVAIEEGANLVRIGRAIFS